MFTAILTNAGRAAMAGAQFGGYKVDLVRFKVSDTVITETDPEVIKTYTELPGAISYDSGNYPTDHSIKYEVINDVDINITVFLSAEIGPFTIGSVGLYLSDGTLFYVLQLPQSYPKTANTGSVAGNAYAYPVISTISVLDVINLTVLPENFATLPQVTSESSLPDYNLAPNGNYFVQNFAGTGKSAIACRSASAWQFIPSSNVDLFEGWIKVDSTSFDSLVVEGNVVYFNYTTNKWEQLDSNNLDAKLIGIKQGGGVRTSSFYYKQSSFIPNTDYYCDVSPNQGKLTTLATNYFVGTALTNSVLSLDPKKINNDLLFPILPKLFNASVDSSGIWQLSLSSGEILPELYETGLEIRFLAPSSNIANQRVQIQGLGAVYLTQLPPSYPSLIRPSVNSITAYNLVEAVYIQSDDIGGGFRLRSTYGQDSQYIGDYKQSAQNANHGNWLLCNGQAVSRSTYSLLFNLIGTSFGVGNGSTTFNLPDCQGRVAGSIGSGSGLTTRTAGQVVGAETHTLTSAQVGSNTWAFTKDDGDADVAPRATVEKISIDGVEIVPSGGSNTTYTTTVSPKNQAAHNNMQPTIFIGNTFIYSGV